ncbi:uncharacterized protein [Rhodnius prolixus]
MNSGGAKESSQSNCGDSLTVDCSGISAIMSKLDLITKDLELKTFDIKKEIKEIKDDFKQVTTNLEANLEKFRSENASLKKITSQLEKDIINLNVMLQENLQYSRFSGVKISNIPYSADEDLYAKLKIICEVIEFDFKTNKFANCLRLISRFNKMNTNFPPTIILKFINERDRSEFLEKEKLNREKLVSRLFTSGDSSRIYINELLSPYFYTLLKEAKQYQRINKLKYVWFRNNRLLVRIDDKSPAIRIRCKDDFFRFSDSQMDLTSEFDEPETGSSLPLSE